MQPVKLLERAATGAAHVIRHPISSAAYAAGVARGLAGAVVHGATVHGHDPEAGPPPVPAQRAAQRPAQRAAQRPAADPVRDPAGAAEPAPPREPAPVHESFATEPKAASRQSEHGGPSDDAEIDAWTAEAADEPDIDIVTPVGTTGAAPGVNPDTAEADLQQPGTEPLLDPATAKAIRSESETMQKAADPDKG